MDNRDWIQWSDLNHQQLAHVKVIPQMVNAVSGEWINVQQAAQLHGISMMSARPSDDGSGINVTNTPPWLDEIMRELSAASTGKQIAVGSFSGWCSGYLVGRIGKAAALAVGGSLIILQVAHYQGLIRIDWNKVKRGVESTQRKFGQRVNSTNVSTVMNAIVQFGRSHVFLAGSFGAGFLIGLAM